MLANQSGFEIHMFRVGEPKDHLHARDVHSLHLHHVFMLLQEDQ